MRRGWFNRGMMLALASALFFSACEQSPVEAPVEAPEQSVVQDMLASASGDYTLIESAPIESNGLLGGLLKVVGGLLNLVVKVIGLDGGLLTVGDHSLLVPAGAVLEPTEFRMELLDMRWVAVDLTAKRRGEDVGSQGFEKPVKLTLSYANARVSDPTKLYILRLMPDGRHERLPSVVDLEKKTVSAELDHFSKYAMACN